jgi:transcriptional regulator with XRE-family HTH domain
MTSYLWDIQRCPEHPRHIGEHIKKRRFDLKLPAYKCQKILGVDKGTLTDWERGKHQPCRQNQKQIIKFLGYDPFASPELGRPRGNETIGVAFLASAGPFSLGQQIIKRRLDLKKTRKECAQELGVSVKTLWGWERDQHKPSPFGRERIRAVLALDLELSFPTGDFQKATQAT